MNTTIRIDDFRAENDTQTFANAMAYMRTHPGTTLVVAPGTYTITTTLARETQAMVMSGGFGENPEPVMFSPSFEYSKGISMEGQTGSTLIAYGVTLLVDGFMEPLSLENCADITVKGLTVDHKRKPFSKGIVTEVLFDEEGPTHTDKKEIPGSVTVAFLPEYPINEKMPVVRTCFFNPDICRFNMAAGIRGRAITGKQTMVLTCSDIRGITVGTEFYACHTYHSRPAIRIENASNISLEDVTIHSQPGMGIVGHRSENIVMKGLRVVPGPGEHFSTNTDATHFTSCKGNIRFEGCTFEGHGDDATNVHTYYHSITKKLSDTQYEIRLEAPTGTHSQTPDYPDKGDVLELTDAETLGVVSTYTVKEVIPHFEEFYSEVEVDGTLPEVFDDYFFADITRLPRLEFIRCFVKNHFARSVLVKTRSVLIEGCTFIDADLCAVEVAAESWWKEGVCSADVMIRGNRIQYLGEKRNNGIRGSSGITVTMDANLQQGTPHKGITIEDNLIDCPGSEHGIYISNAENVTVRRNRICCAGEPVRIEDCENIRR